MSCKTAGHEFSHVFSLSRIKTPYFSRFYKSFRLKLFYEFFTNPLIFLTVLNLPHLLLMMIILQQFLVSDNPVLYFRFLCYLS